MNIVEVSVAQLKPNTYNPNQQSVNDFDLLVKSIQEDGFTLPVVVNDGSLDDALKDMIIDGEHRWRAAKVLGMETIPVIYRAMDQAGMRVSTIRHNQARGSHDEVMEAAVLRSLVETVSPEELSLSLNIDSVELDAMLDRAVEYDERKGLSELLKEDLQKGLEQDGLPEIEAGIVAQRHAMIASPSLLKKEDGQQGDVEAYQNVRFEFVYAGEQAEFMRGQVRKAGSGLKLLLQLREVSREDPS